MESPKINEAVQAAMNTDSVLEAEIYQAVPSLYEKDPAARALRDEAVRRTHPLLKGLSVYTDDKDLPELAKNILSLNTKELLEKCKKMTHVPTFSLVYQQDLFQRCCYYIPKIFQNGEKAPLPVAQKEVDALTAVLKKHDPEMIGPLVERLGRPALRKRTLHALLKNREETRTR